MVDGFEEEAMVWNFWCAKVVGDVLLSSGDVR
jgi:hypothetical protein